MQQRFEAGWRFALSEVEEGEPAAPGLILLGRSGAMLLVTWEGEAEIGIGRRVHQLPPDAVMPVPEPSSNVLPQLLA